MRDHRKWMMIIWIVVMVFMVATVQIKATTTDNRIIADNIASCERVNKLRVEANTTTIIIRDFLIAAVNARQEEAEHSTGKIRKENLATAKEYSKLVEKLTTVPLTDCEKEFRT